MDIHLNNKRLLQQLRTAMYDFDSSKVKAALDRVFSPAATVKLSFPFENLVGAEGLLEQALLPLHRSIPDLERRDTIVMAGNSADGCHWVGCCGYYTGTFSHDWLDIPSTGHQVPMRFHEFYRIEQNKVVEMQALWDIPEVMMQANAWPMVPSLGREWHVPGPATQDGLQLARDPDKSQLSLNLVEQMCNDLGNYRAGGVEAMHLEQYWHPRCNWYGPSGIGTGRGISGFRNWHQIPFLNGLPDRVGDVDGGHLFSDGDYVGFTAWPGMSMSVSGRGWLGIAPAGQNITMRSLDFWRCENGMIRENWVLIDLLDVYNQLGVDVFARLREFNKARTHSRLV